MSDDEFINKELSDFSAAYSAADGWKVMRASPDAQENFSGVLPAFLRIKRPGDFKESIITDVVYAHKLPRKLRRLRLTALPHLARGPGLEESNWTGEISFTWKGSPIRVQRGILLKNNTPIARSPNLTLYAFKDESAFTDLLREGMKFVRRRSGSMKTQVWVVNGLSYARPKASWDDLILPADIKAQIRENFEGFLAAKKRYKELGIPYRRGFLLVGPPGNGKTMLTKVIAGAYRVNMVSLHLKSDLDENAVTRAFSLATHYQPCVLLLEDLDKLAACTRVSLSYILNLLDGLNAPEGVLVIATSNEPHKLDGALLHRPSRFDRVWEFALPGPAQRTALLFKRAGRIFSREALERASSRMDGFSMAYVQEAVTSALMLSIQRKAPLLDEHLDTVVEQLRAQIKTASGVRCAPVAISGSLGFNKEDL